MPVLRQERRESSAQLWTRAVSHLRVPGSTCVYSPPERDTDWATGETLMAATRCPGHGRHWFAVRRAVGMRSPYCVRCGAPNPRPLSDEERREFIDWNDSMGERAGRRYREWRANQVNV